MLLSSVFWRSGFLIHAYVLLCWYVLCTFCLNALTCCTHGSFHRLIHRAVDDLTIARSIQEIEKQRAKQARLEDTAAKHQSANSGVASVTAMNTPEPMSGVTSEPNRAVPSEARGESSASQVQKEARWESFGASKSAEPMETDVPSVGTSGVRSVQSQPVDKAGPSSGGAEAAGAALSSLENIPGVQVFRPSDFQDLTPQEQEVRLL